MPLKAFTSQRFMTHRKYGGAGWVNMPGFRWIDLPAEAIDDVCTVIKVEFEGPIDIVDIDQQKALT